MAENQVNCKVLFIDDDPGIRRAFSRVMATRGFETECAGTGAEAVRLAEECSYPIIVTDLRMPGMDGLTLIERLRPLQPHAAYVVISGMPDLDLNRANATANQIDAVLSKPWNADELEEVLRRAASLYQQRCGVSEVPPEDSPSVLVIEDNPTDAETIRGMLAPVASEVVLAERLAEALQLMRGRSFDAVLADLSLPDARGLDVVVRLRTLAPDAAIVILGGLDDEDVALRGVQMGVQDYMSKRTMDSRSLRRTLRYSVERKRAEQRLAYLARHDQLTGLANRTTFLEKLNAALARARRQAQPIAVLFVDVDRFKAINDSLGHEAGDYLLKTVSLRLQQCVREYDTVARIGGDEFAILLEDLQAPGGPTDVSQRILSALTTPIMMNDIELVMTGSVGVAVHPQAGDTSERLMKAADSALHAAKAKGRNNFQMAVGDDDADATKRIRLTAELRHALKAKQFLLFYQPQIDIRERRVVGLEALLRWRKSDGRLVSPLEFIPILEDTGLIVEVGAWVLEQACLQLRRWRDEGMDKLRVAVNLSAKQFETDGLIRVVQKALQISGIEPDGLELEITESLLMQDTSHTNLTLEALKSMGLRIAVDDFGTGYSSLAYLERFRVDVLKVDRSFINAINVTGRKGSVAGAIVGLGHRLGLEVVAEGVETQDQLLHLQSNDCDMVQGFYFAKPADNWKRDSLEDIITRLLPEPALKAVAEG